MSVNLKEELFFIKETIRYGYGWKGVLKYLVNKFWNSKKIYSLKLPDYGQIEGVEIHILCRKKDADMLAWSLMSFISQSGICPKVIVHDDGTFDKNTVNKLELKFPELKVLSFKKANELIKNTAGLSSSLLEHRNKGHKLIHKLIDVFLLSRSEKVMLLDSDILFFNRPEEILEFIHGDSNYDSLITKNSGKYDLELSENYFKKYESLKGSADFMNSGVILYKRDKIDFDKLLEYFENTRRMPGDYLVEMSGWACLIAQTRFKFLSPDKYPIKGKLDPNAIMKHFTNPRRHEFYIYGIDKVREAVTYKNEY